MTRIRNPNDTSQLVRTLAQATDILSPGRHKLTAAEQRQLRQAARANDGKIDSFERAAISAAGRGLTSATAFQAAISELQRRPNYPVDGRPTVAPVSGPPKDPYLPLPPPKVLRGLSLEARTRFLRGGALQAVGAAGLTHQEFRLALKAWDRWLNANAPQYYDVFKRETGRTVLDYAQLHSA